MTDIADEQNDDELERELEVLADQLAHLSEGDLPEGHGDGFIPFDASDVDWQSNDWLARLDSVQPWLQLEEPFKIAAGPDEALAALFETLGEDNPSECYVVNDGHACLTLPGVAALSNRASTAVNYKEEFTQLLEEGASLKQASRAWTELWEEDSPSDDSIPVEVHASVSTWRTQTFSAQAAQGYLTLNPSYQRDSVWSDKESIGLIDSILRGIPLPSIILNQRKGDDTVEIVDGKQRLTAILRFIGHHPDGVSFAKRKSKEADVSFDLFTQDYRKWRKLVKKAVGLSNKEEGASFLPFPFRLPSKASNAQDQLAKFSGKYYCELLDEQVTIQGRQEKVSKVFDSPTTMYHLPVILYENTDIRQIHKVFGLYNKQGKKLNATEVRNAIYHHLDLTRLMLLLSGDSSDRDGLAPYLQADDIDLAVIPDALEGMGVARSRFNRTKLTSWVAALLLHPLEKKKIGLATPGSTKLIDDMLKRITESPRHPLKDPIACAVLAEHLTAGAHNLTELRNMYAIAPSFQRKGSPNEKWDDLPAVAAWTAFTLAAFAGVMVNPAMRSTVEQATKEIAPLEKQQAKTQWVYLASTILRLLDALGVDREALAPVLSKHLGNNCLITLDAVANLEA